MVSKTINLFPQQFEVMNFETQFALVCAGKQSGKTFVGSCWTGTKIVEFPEEMTGAIIAPTYKILHQSTLPKLFSLYPRLRKMYKEQKGEIVISENPSQIIFTRSAEDPLGIEGMSPNWMWLDEAGQMKRLIWSTVRGRVSMTRGQVLMTTTAYNLGWLFREYYLPWKNKLDSSFSFFSWRSIDNPNFPEDFFEAERRRLSPEEFARNYCGEFRKMEGLVFDLRNKCVVNARSLRSLANPKYIAGIDWGFSNPAGILIICIANNKYYIVDEWKQRGKTTAEIIKQLQKFMNLYPISKIYPDPAEPDRIKELEYAGIISEEVTKDVKGGISFVQQLFKDDMIIVNENCREFLDETSSYHYDPNRPTDYPVKENDHLLDCLRYALFSLHLNLQNVDVKLTDAIVCGDF